MGIEMYKSIKKEIINKYGLKDSMGIVEALNKITDPTDLESFKTALKYPHGKPNKCDICYEWKDHRIREINNMGIVCDDCHPNFEEVQAIYKSDANTYKQFKEEFKNARNS